MVYNEKKVIGIFGALVFVFALIPYLLTVQPTVPFWDCGEFVACGNSMGVPHPPGSPLFVILGRVVIMALSFIKEISLRMNLISVFSGALTALLIYLSVIRIFKMWFKPGDNATLWERLIPVIGGFASGLLCTYSYTPWFSCVESESYAFTMLIIFLEVWLALKWFDFKGTADGDKMLIFITFLAYLGIGSSLYTMIPVPFVFLFVVMNEPQKLKHYQLWLVGFCILSIMYSIASFLIIAPVLLVYCLLWIFLDKESAKYINGVFIGFFGLWQLKNALPQQNDGFDGLDFIMGLTYLALAILPFMVQVQSKVQERSKWYLCFWLIFAATLGYSVNFVMPIRSFLDPMIDENNPEVVIKEPGDIFKKETWNQLFYFLERKQYGDESMVMRMFHRRGTLFHQFINHRNMGFGGYLVAQLYNFGDLKEGSIELGDNAGKRAIKLLLYLAPLFLVIWAVAYIYKRERKGAVFLGALLLANTLGLIFYMNFADGTQPENRDLVQWERNGRMGPQPEPVQLEVRERDYFYSAGYLLYSMWVGIGLACLLHSFAQKYRGRKMFSTLGPLIAVLVMATPAIPLSINMGLRTRADNWVAYDYAYNLLQSCERDGILFTNGDNDTFPLWALQEGYGTRRDVRIVNLSLLNTDWYIAQLFDHKPVITIPTVVFDEYFRPQLLSKENFVTTINHHRNMLQKPQKVVLSSWKLEVEVPDIKKKNFFRIQDYMVMNIVHGNAGKRPIYFAVTVSEGNMMGLESYLSMEGLVYRLTQEHQTSRMNIERTLFNLDKVYRYTFLGRKGLYLGPDNERLLSNYAASFIGYVYEERSNLMRLRQQEKDLESGINGLKAAKKVDAAAVAAKESELAAVRIQADSLFANMQRELERCISILPMDWRSRVLAAQIYAQDNKYDLAEAKLKEGLNLNPDEFVYVSNMGLFLRDIGKEKEAMPYFEKAVNVLDNDLANVKHRETLGMAQALVDMYKKEGQKEKAENLEQKLNAVRSMYQRMRSN